MPRQSHSSLFINPIIMCDKCRAQSSSLCSISPVSCYLVPLCTKYLLEQSILERPQPTSFLNVRDQISHPHKTRGKIIVIFMYALFNTYVIKCMMHSRISIILQQL
jgi:hypothetical protein